MLDRDAKEMYERALLNEVFEEAARKKRIENMLLRKRPDVIDASETCDGKGAGEKEGEEHLADSPQDKLDVQDAVP
jgi:hypothetical protein